MRDDSFMVLNDKTLDGSNFPAAESASICKTYRLKPELGMAVIPFHMHMNGLSSLIRVEKEAVRAVSENRGHRRGI